HRSLHPGRALQDAVAPIGVIQIDPSGHLSPAALSGSPALGDDEHRRRRGPDTRDPQRGRPLSRLADTLTGSRPADGQLIRQTPRLLRLSSPPWPRRPPPARCRRPRPSAAPAPPPAVSAPLAAGAAPPAAAACAAASRRVVRAGLLPELAAGGVSFIHPRGGALDAANDSANSVTQDAC